MRMEMSQELSGRVMKIMLEKERECFGTEMLKHSPVKGMLGAYVHSVDRCPLYIYEVGDRILLSEYLKKEICTRDDWMRLMGQLVELLEQAAEYFLSERDILLQTDALFYDEKEKQIYALYLDGYDGDVANGIAKILEDFMNVMNHQDKDLVFMVYGLHRIAKESNFSTNRLKEYMKDSMRENIPWEEITTTPNEEFVRTEEKKETKKPPKTLATQGKKEKEKEQPINILILLLMGVFFLILAWKTQVLLHPVTKEPDIKKTILFLGVWGMVEGIGVYRECKSFLGKRKEKVVLIPLECNLEPIRVLQSPCYIGSNMEQAEKVIDREDISTVHAKIVLEEERAYLIDQESDSGTWINEKQLVPWERNKLQQGDTIRLASHLYEVMFP